MGVPISYHKPTGMVNITQILNLLDTKIISKMGKVSVQEARGSPQWEGYYIDIDSATKIMLQHSIYTDHNTWNSNKQATSPSESFGNTKEQSIAVVTDEMIGHMLVDRQLGSVVWNGRELTVERAKEVCAKHHLIVAYNTLDNSECSESTWTSSCPDEDILRLLEHSDQSVAASHNSSKTNGTNRFVKRKRQRANIPELPQQRPPRVAQILPDEKVKQWIAEGPDIRPSRFSKRAGKDEESPHPRNKSGAANTSKSSLVIKYYFVAKMYSAVILRTGDAIRTKRDTLDSTRSNGGNNWLQHINNTDSDSYSQTEEHSLSRIAANETRVCTEFKARS